MKPIDKKKGYKDYPLKQLVLMAILQLGKNAYGVRIQEEIEKRTGTSVLLTTIHITLDRLEMKGYVSSWLGDPTPQRGGRAKKFFKIEASGEEALLEHCTALNKMGKGLKP